MYMQQNREKNAVAVLYPSFTVDCTVAVIYCFTTTILFYVMKEAIAFHNQGDAKYIGQTHQIIPFPKYYVG